MPSPAPTKKLRVSIGSSRFSQQIASVNDIAHPTLIDTPLFAGRIVVYVKDFAGETPDGSPPIRECSYFDGRSRKFAILIEGRFKRRDGVEPYTGCGVHLGGRRRGEARELTRCVRRRDEVHFGSDFDRLPETFPHGPFNAGMRIGPSLPVRPHPTRRADPPPQQSTLTPRRSSTSSPRGRTSCRPTPPA